MRILAIDPGSKLGWATDATGRLEWGTENFTIKNGESSGNRWRRFGEWLTEAAGMFPVLSFDKAPSQEEVARIIDDMRHKAGVIIHPGTTVMQSRKVDLIIYEKAMFMPKARAAAEIAAGFTTRLEEHCERHGIALQPVAVQTLKAFALPKVKRKKGDPKMDRSKEAMIRAAEHRLGVEIGQISSEPITWHCGPLSEHEADALHLFWWAKENCLRREGERNKWGVGLSALKR